MNTFAQEFSKKENVTYTQNGCVTNKSTFNKNLDFFAQASAMRGMNGDVVDMFRNCFNEDANLAIRNLYYLRDVRGGAGERDLFRSCMHYLSSRVSITAFGKIVKHIPQYGRWDDLFDLLKYMVNCTDKKINYKGAINICLKMIFEQLKEDIKNCSEGKPISLLSKWFPIANNRHTPEAKKFARWLYKQFFNNEANCRKVIVALRKHANVLEQKLSANEWDKVKYESVPSGANLKYRKAFIRHDIERYNEYIANVNLGKANMNAAVLYPYQITKKIVSSWYFANHPETIDPNSDEGQSLIAMWNNLPNYVNKDTSAIVVVDTSGSMTWGDHKKVLPIEVAMSLGVYFSERNTGPFKDMFFTFSTDPKCSILSGDNIIEKIRSVDMNNCGFSTDIYKLFKLYLDIAKKSNPEDCPKNIVIISDMEFNAASDTNDTAMKSIDKMFAAENIERPNLIFWNVNSSGKNVPVTYDENGTALVSGSSPSAFKFVASHTTPYEMMLEVLNSDRYNTINIY